MEITQIKAQLDIQTVLNHYNLSPDRNHRLNCPWHNDKTPSLQIYPKTNTWTCFSSNCTAGSGDVIEMIQKMEKCTKHEALKKAAELCGEIKSQPSLSETFNKIRQSLYRSKNAIAYPKDRNIYNKELEIGYNQASPSRNPTVVSKLSASRLTTAMVNFTSSRSYLPIIE